MLTMTKVLAIIAFLAFVAVVTSFVLIVWRFFASRADSKKETLHRFVGGPWDGKLGYHNPDLAISGPIKIGTTSGLYWRSNKESFDRFPQLIWKPSKRHDNITPVSQPKDYVK